MAVVAAKVVRGVIGTRREVATAKGLAGVVDKETGPIPPTQFQVDLVFGSLVGQETRAALTGRMVDTRVGVDEELRGRFGWRGPGRTRRRRRRGPGQQRLIIWAGTDWRDGCAADHGILLQGTLSNGHELAIGVTFHSRHLDGAGTDVGKRLAQRPVDTPKLRDRVEPQEHVHRDLGERLSHPIEQVVAGNEAFQIVLRDGPGGAGKPDSHVAGPLHGVGTWQRDNFLFGNGTRDGRMRSSSIRDRGRFNDRESCGLGHWSGKRSSSWGWSWWLGNMHLFPQPRFCL